MPPRLPRARVVDRITLGYALLVALWLSLRLALFDQLWWAAEDVEAATGSGDEHALGALELVEERGC